MPAASLVNLLPGGKYILRPEAGQEQDSYTLQALIW
jgi:hypothetical protein